MVNNEDQQFVIVEMKDELRCEGILEHIDKVNLLIYLAKAKTYLIGESGQIIPKGTFEVLKLNKADIKVIKLVQIDKSKTEEVSNPVESETFAVKEIPKKEENIAPVKKAYEKEAFFDNMISGQTANIRSTVKYDDKNAETFNMKDDSNFQYYRGRGGYRGSYRGGRGGYNYQRGAGNYYSRGNYRGGSGLRGSNTFGDNARVNSRGGKGGNYRGNRGFGNKRGGYNRFNNDQGIKFQQNTNWKENIGESLDDKKNAETFQSNLQYDKKYNFDESKRLVANLTSKGQKGPKLGLQDNIFG